MTSTPTLGDFFRQAGQHLQAAAFTDEPRRQPDTIAPAATQAARAARALSRYLDDICTGQQVEVLMAQDTHTPLHAAAHTRQALHLAEKAFLAAAREAGPYAGACAAADEFSAATSCMTTGRDLIATHFLTDPAGTEAPLSAWAPVIRSAAVTRAMLEHTSHPVRQLAVWTSRAIHAGTSRIPDQAITELEAASHWLAMAAKTLATTRRDHPAAPTDKILLEAIPASAVPPQNPPTGTEDRPELCGAITATAVRLRAAARWQPGEAAWSPSLTAESWRRQATAAAIICDLSRALLESLDQRATRIRIAPRQRAPLPAAARAAAAACGSWQDTAAAWKELTTETRGLTSLALTDTTDLLLRLGRLTFDNPAWTPAGAHEAPLRDAAALARTRTDIAQVLAAVHAAADALALTAAIDEHAVDIAIQARRLYLPTRTMPEAPRQTGLAYHPASPADTAPLSRAYAAAVRTSRDLVLALDTAALALQAPSRALALARTAARTPRSADTRQNARPPSVIDPDTSPKGSVEQLVRQLGVQEPMLLLRAKAVDAATQQILSEAWDADQPPRKTATRAAIRDHQHAGNLAVALASRDFPTRRRATPAATAEPAPANGRTTAQPPGTRPRSGRN